MSTGSLMCRISLRPIICSTQPTVIWSQPSLFSTMTLQSKRLLVYFDIQSSDSASVGSNWARKKSLPLFAYTVGVTGSDAPTKKFPDFTIVIKKFAIMPARHQPSKPSKPRPNSHLSDSEITRILTLDHSGLSGWAIASQVNRGEATVRRNLKTYDYKTFDGRDRTRINKRKTTNREDRILTRTAKVHDDQAYHNIIYIHIPIYLSLLAQVRDLEEVIVLWSVPCP